MEAERVMNALRERLEKHDSNRRQVQDRLHAICEEWRKQIDDVEHRINSELEEQFAKEDNRLQNALCKLQAAAILPEEKDSLSEALRGGKAELLVRQRYALRGDVAPAFAKALSLVAEKETITEWLDLNEPPILQASSINTGRVCVRLRPSNVEQERVLAECGFDNAITYSVSMEKKDSRERNAMEYTTEEERERDTFSFVPASIEAETAYGIKVRAEFQCRKGEWSKETELMTPSFSECCAWKECHQNIDNQLKYSVCRANPRVATKTDENGDCTIIGNTSLPQNKVTSWTIELIEISNKMSQAFIGVAPFYIDQSAHNNFSGCGWYLCCDDLTLYSGPPHNYWDQRYSQKKEDRECVHKGDNVGVVMDTAKGELSFAVNGVNLGVAYEGIPLDKPLVPCVIIFWENNSVGLRLN